jgi:hypothetical protein
LPPKINVKTRHTGGAPGTIFHVYFGSVSRCQKHCDFWRPRHHFGIESGAKITTWTVCQVRHRRLAIPIRIRARYLRLGYVLGVDFCIGIRRQNQP